MQNCRVADSRWRMVGTGNQLAVFTGDCEEPLLLPHALPITAASVSPCARFLAVGSQSQLTLYEIRKGGKIVLVKHLPELPVDMVRTVAFLSNHHPVPLFLGSPHPTLVFTDARKLFLLTIELGLLLTTIKLQELSHSLFRIDCCAAIRTEGASLVAVGGKSELEIVQIEEREVQKLRLSEEGVEEGKVCVAWMTGGRGLAVGCGERVRLLRVGLREGRCWVEEHLVFVNHYCIEEVFLLSPYHLLLQSTHNFAVVGLPLIPSALDTPDLAHSEAALVFSLHRPEGHRVLCASEEGILLWWGGVLQEGRLRGLEEELEELLVGRSAYREAFALLVLVARGMNYSYRFSYTPEDLRRAIYGALEVAVNSFLPQLDPRIALFRVGWAVQFCLETSQQDLLWEFLHPRLKQKALTGQLFEVLQTYALRGQLVNVPEEPLLEAVEYYAQRGSQAVVEGLLLANRQACEPGRLLALLNQKEMNYLQFSLFSRGILCEEPDFYTPFLRAFASFSRASGSNADEAALLCYFILTKTFLLEHVPSGMMSRETKLHVVTHFFPQSLARPFLRKLADYDLRLLLEALLVPFMHPEFRQLLAAEEPEVLQR